MDESSQYYDFRSVVAIVDMDRTILDTTGLYLKLLELLKQGQYLSEYDVKLAIDVFIKKERPAEHSMNDSSEVEFFSSRGIELSVLRNLVDKHLDLHNFIYADALAFGAFMKQHSMSWVIMTKGEERWQRFKLDLLNTVSEFREVDSVIVPGLKAQYINKSVEDSGIGDSGLMVVDDRTKHLDGLNQQIRAFHLRRMNGKYRDQDVDELENTVPVEDFNEIISLLQPQQ